LTNKAPSKIPAAKLVIMLNNAFPSFIISVVFFGLTFQ
jgi:hypothetical protein